MHSVQDYLSDPVHGLVREVRDSQLKMATSVEEVIKDGGVYFVEGPVGLGKGYAYLVPSLLAQGKRIVIATAKKQLQDQLAEKDLPAIAQAFGDGLKPLLVNTEGKDQLLRTVIKGKGNYACKLLAEKQLESRPEPGYLPFLATSSFGDRADYPGAPPQWWSAATAEECIGRGCKYSQNCGYIRLKGDVTQSRVVIINHHVLGADMFYGHGKMTGGKFDVLIVDEAHKLAEGIRSAFTVRASETSVSELDTSLSRTSFKFSSPKLIEGVWQAMFKSLPNRHYRDPHIRELPVFPQYAPEAVQGLESIDDELAKLLAHYGVKGNVGDPDFWTALAEVNVPDDVRRDLVSVAQSRRKMDALIRGVNTMQGVVNQREEEEPDDYERRKTQMLQNTVAFGNVDHRGKFNLSCAPISLGGIAQSYLKAVGSVVITSATLAVNDSFDHLDEIVGVKATKEEVLPSSFDYDGQGFVYIPKDMPHLQRDFWEGGQKRENPEYRTALQNKVQRAVRLVELSQGGAFVLTTANDELDAFAVALKRQFPGRVFVQGHAKNGWDGDPPSVLEQFLATPNAVLVGSKSFWEGVDVPGERLRLVIMAKLPFPQFNDPIVKARERLAGDAAFKKVQLVDMLIDLRQGAGRLIRSKTDRGCVAILDSRVWDKRAYGGSVIKALPWSRDMVTSDITWCEKYLPKFVSYFRNLKINRQPGAA